MVRLLILPLKKVVGSVMAVGLAKIKPADPLLASIVPPLLIGELPEIVKVLAPTVNVPEVNANVPDTLTEPPNVIPLGRFKVKLFSEIVGKEVLAPVPPKAMLEVAPPVNVPEVLTIAPFMVNVFAPMAKLPEVSVSVCETVKSPLRVRPLLLFKVRPSTVLLTKAPPGMV
jgi:hypothetical protein